MKKWILISVCSCSYLGTAQSSASNTVSPDKRFRENAVCPVTFTFGFKKYEFLENSLSVYNPTSMMTNKYVAFGNGYARINASEFPATLNGITADSFNPSGTADMKSALGMGLIRTIFKL